MKKTFISEINENDYYAVIFSSKRTSGDNGYNKMGDEMIKLASSQNGFLGCESTRDFDGNGITVSYWKEIEDIENWKNNSDHIMAQKYGQETWYKEYALRITKVIRQKYCFKNRASAQQAPELGK